MLDIIYRICVLFLMCLSLSCSATNDFFIFERPFFEVGESKITKEQLGNCPDGSDFFAVDVSETEELIITATCMYDFNYSAYVEHTWVNGKKVSERLNVEGKYQGINRFKLTENTFGVIEYCNGFVNRVELYNENMSPRLTVFASNSDVKVKEMESYLELADVLVNYEDSYRSSNSQRLGEYMACNYSDIDIPALSKWLFWEWAK